MKTIAAAALSAALLAALTAWQVQSWRLGRVIAQAEQQHAEQMRTLSEAALQAEAEARAEEQRRTAEVQKVANETRLALERARLDADSAADAGRRLRAQIATLTASCRAASSDSATATGGAPTDATADLLADVQRRIDEATNRIAAHADAARAAGTACQRSYEALMR
jgi:hypothetical protein